jgi:hypothetical protein
VEDKPEANPKVEMEQDNSQHTPADESNSKPGLTNKQLLRIEKSLFVTAVALAEFYMFIKFGGVKWIADETILLFIAPPIALLGVWVRRTRKKKFPKPVKNA